MARRVQRNGASFSAGDLTDLAKWLRLKRAAQWSQTATVPSAGRTNGARALDQLLGDVTPENRHGETSFGPPVGREIW
jgi:hypothetical protein